MGKRAFRFIALTLITVVICCTTLFNKTIVAKGAIYEATTVKQMEDFIFNAIQNRETSIKIKYTGDTSNIMNITRQARDNAVERDPYEEGCIALISGFNVSVAGNQADISFNSFQYYTTKEQEDFVNTEVNRIVNQITNNNMNADEKEKAIHDYIISNVSYDNTLAGYTAYSALHDKVTVCNGYAQLVYKMMRQAGIDTKIIKGSIVDGGNSENHEWNMVNIRGDWYHLDATLNEAKTKNSSVISNEYYNVTDAFIVKTHSYDRSMYPAANKTYLFQPSVQPPVISGGDTNVSIDPPTKQEIIPPKVNTKAELPMDVEEITTLIEEPQPTNVMWKFFFNFDFNLSNINNSKIFIVDSDGYIVPGVTFRKVDNMIYVDPPSGGYVSGRKYFMYILKTLSPKEGENLENNIKIPFIIK